MGDNLRSNWRSQAGKIKCYLRRSCQLQLVLHYLFHQKSPIATNLEQGCAGIHGWLSKFPKCTHVKTFLINDSWVKPMLWEDVSQWSLSLACPCLETGSHHLVSGEQVWVTEGAWQNPFQQQAWFCHHGAQQEVISEVNGFIILFYHHSTITSITVFFCLFSLKKFGPNSYTASKPAALV